MKAQVRSLRYKYNFQNYYLPVVTLLLAGLLLTWSTPVNAQTGSATASVSVSNATPSLGNQVVATININLSGVNAPDNLLGSYTGTLNWNTAVLSYQSNSGAPPASFTGSVNTASTGSGQITFNGANASGAAGTTIVISITFNVTGTGTSQLDLAYSAMATANTFKNLIPVLTINDSQVSVSGPAGSISYLGDIGSNSIKNSSTASLVVTTTTAVSAGNDIIIAYATDPSQDLNIAITDAVGNKYQQAAMAISSGNVRSYIFAAYNVIALPGGSAITITQTVYSSTTVAARAAVVSVFSGLANSGALEQTSTASGTGSTSPSSGAVTTVYSDQLLIGVIGTEGPGSDAAGTWSNSFTAGPRTGSTATTTDAEITVSMGWRIVSVAGSYTAAKTGITSRDYGAAIASFKTADAGISFIGDIGRNQLKTAGTSLVITTNTAVIAGDDIMVSYAADEEGTVSSMVDGAGNTYTLVLQSVNDMSGTAAGVRTQIYAAYNVNALSAGSTITINHSSVTARSAVVSVFRGLANISVVDQTKTATGTTATVSTGATSATTQTNELLIGIVGLEGPNVDAPSVWQNSFTFGPRLGTNFGSSSGDATDITVQTGWRIVSSTGAYTAQLVDLNTTRDWATGIATLKSEGGLPVMPEYNVLLGRPTATSVTVNGIFDQSGAVYFEYGKTSGNYNSGQTSTLTATSGESVGAVISGLDPDTRYYYRARFQPSGNPLWAAGTEHTFQTQRVKSETYKFTITSDSHLGETFSGITPARYEQTTLNIAADNPDFSIDLGDAFMMNTPTNQTQANDIYKAQRPYFGNYSHSAAVFLALGNHELESGWNLDDTPFSKALASIIARKQYFPNPKPDGFYSGNTDLLAAVGGDQYREDYYSWEWGDALFVVIDPFQYTMTKPYGNVTGSGEDNDETVSGDQWNWTLGLQQFNWLKQTLENSHTKYKFVFSHHLCGGILNVSGGAGTPEYVRGGADAALNFEWGGQNANGTNGFATKRPGWGDTPIHQMMVANGVSAYFHGHDHQFVHEERDGIVYQEVPSASMTGFGFDLYDGSPYVMTENNILGNLSNSGHLRITVNSNQATVEYVKSNENNGQVAYSYTISPNATIEPEVTITSPNGGENLQVGSTHNITWSSTGITGNVHIEYSTNNGSAWSDVIANTSNTGSYSWTIPGATSVNCLVRVSDLDGTPSDVSNAVFTISPIPVITVIAPNGGENWQVGSIHNITWSSTGITGNVHIEYSTNNGSAWSDVIASTSNTGSYSWTIPNATSANCIVKVSDLDGTPSDVSNAVLIISAVPYITVLSPNGGEDWKIGSSHTILWTSAGTSGIVQIEYSTNSGTNWTSINSNTTDDGSYIWTIPDDPSTSCVIRVSDTDASPLDVSNSMFTISPEPDKHFTPVWSGNGFDHMNFYAITAALDGADLQPGDEIGIFDGTFCVGSGKLTQILNGINYLEIRVSADDPTTPETDGYLSGHNAAFKIWDASAHNEISSVQITYETGSNSIFSSGASSWYHISGISLVNQEITLSNGWSIFSLYVTPGNINMQQVVQPLIDAGSLVKVQNEGGAALEKIPGTSTWVNNIGNWINTEGYKIRVNTLSSLIVSGVPIAAPITVDLISGWNIISYPTSVSQDAMQILNSLVPSGSLVKVQDQAGNAIELIPNTTNWINNIGNFDPDEGYKVRVSANGVLTMTNSSKGSKGSLVSTATNSATQYFKPVLIGNGLDQMNFYLTDVSEGEYGLKPGDEIGIFDGSNCVGAAKITKTGEKFYSFVASADDPTTEEIDGFIKGHSPIFRLWRPAINSEATIGKFDYYPGSDKVFVPMGTAAISINVSALGLNKEVELSTSLGNIYPNPFRGETTIPYVVGRESSVDISIYNMLGTKLTTLVHEKLPAGSYKATLNTAFEKNNRIVPGIYYCKMIAGNKLFVKTMVVNY